ncbi:MAG: hypothetical protein EDM05_63500 [Leptolyngbya sp. IPPAS B-1204]
MAKDLRDYLNDIEQRGQLRRIQALVDPNLEIAEIANRMLQQGGPALLFENVKDPPIQSRSMSWAPWNESAGA